MKPSDILGFFSLLLVSLAVIALIFPKDGIRLNESTTLDFPSLSSVFSIDTTEQKDYSTILEASFDIDSIDLVEESKKKEQNRVLDSIRQARLKDSLRAWQLKLHFPDNSKKALTNIFRAMETKSKKEVVRIMHFGDSQIEGDRISGYLRYKLQNKFGGNGPGLIPAVPLVRPNSVSVENSDNWKRYTMYGKVDSTVTHKKYGILFSFGRFTQLPEPDSVEIDSTLNFDDQLIIEEAFDDSEPLIDSTELKLGWIDISKSNYTYKSTSTFDELEVYFGNLSNPVTIRTIVNDTLILNEKTYYADKLIHKYSTSFDKQITDVKLEFEAVESPDVYGINLTNQKGIIVDNISMRGSSGTLFRKVNREQFTSLLSDFNPDLIILQYGGNVMPYIDDENECIQYGKWFRSQITLLKKIVPGVSMIVIGPSDMGYFDQGEYVSYELLPVVRDQLKLVTLEQGGVYWDLMEAMGGPGAMRAWVEANPPLAGKDYIHLNRKGAAKISQMFYNALIEEYNEYKER